MKATGIVRRIDDLGRVVVPKEIRRTLRIHEGDPLEIFTDKEGEIILKKYSPMGELGSWVTELCEAVSKVMKRTFVICDRDMVIGASGSLAGELNELPVSTELKKLMEDRTRFDGEKANKSIKISESVESEIMLAYPIITQGDVTGCVVIMKEDQKKNSESEKLIADIMVTFLSGQLEA